MPTILLSLNEAKLWLSATEGDKDDDIQAVIDAAAKVIESRVGPIDQATKVQTFTTSGTNTTFFGGAWADGAGAAWQYLTGRIYRVAWAARAMSDADVAGIVARLKTDHTF